MDNKEKFKRKQNGEPFPNAPKRRKRGPGSPLGHLIRIRGGKFVSMDPENRKAFLREKQKSRRKI